ncbi:hypothetical protein ACS0TY_002726 [Phlomoides rotata]
MADQYKGYCLGVICDFNVICEEGGKFTWYRPDGSCKSKSDKFLVNEEWLEKWPNVTLREGGRILSDHCLIFTEEMKKDWGPKPFRIFNWWMQ